MTAHGANSYLWQPGGYTTPSITVTPQNSGVYIVTGTTNSVSQNDTVTIALDAFSLTHPQISTNGPSTFCTGADVVLTSAQANSYHWTTGSTSQTCSVSQTGIYRVTLTDANNCTAVSDSEIITVNSLPNVSVQPNSDTLCNTANPLQLTGSPAGGTFTGNGITGNQFSPATAGSGLHGITYVYTDNNGCTDSASAAIEVTICTSIQKLEESSLVVYPNPSVDEFNIYGIASDAVSMQLFDETGKLLEQGQYAPNQNRLKLSLSNLPSGIYLVVLSNSQTRLKKTLVKID
jgi:hypothetical protein